MASVDYRKEPARPRSLYTSYNYPQEELSLPAFQDYGKFLEGGLGQTSRHGPAPPYYQYQDDISDGWRDMEVAEGLSVTPHGTIALRLRDRVKVEMTVDGAVRLTNNKNNITMSISKSGALSGLIHPTGRVYQYGSRVEVLARHQHGNKYAKMWYKGVSFTSESCALVYLVDVAGTRTTADTFLDMTRDYTLDVFYNDSRHGSAFLKEAGSLAASAQYWLSSGAVDNWIVNDIRLSQTADGLVRIHRSSHKYQARVSPSNGSASITTPFMHCTASLGQTRHLFVRRGERRMHFDGNTFVVRNAGQSAGFDENNQLKVY